MEELKLEFPAEEFYNTMKAEGEELEQRTSDAKKQRLQVMEYYQKHPEGKFTPFEIHEALGYAETKTPVSSIRRAMTNLTTSKFLIKLTEQKMERLGANNFLWILNKTV